MIVAIVHNPVKVDLDALRAVVSAQARDAHWPEPLWFETSVDDPGIGAARRALDAGAELVIAAGGDGTVRAVAQCLVGSDVSLGIVPAGTGNLLARNLDLPIDDLDAAVTTALTGRDRRIDVGAIELRRPDDTEERHVFLVMAGSGVDAQMLAATDDDLKAKAGWLAYVSALTKVLREENSLRVTYQFDGRRPGRMRANTIIVGNCGSLAGNVLLLPDAALDDGVLDALILRPEGLRNWVQIIAKILIENALLARTPLGRWFRGTRIDAVNYRRTRSLTVRFEDPEPVEIDGDDAGTATRFRTTVEHRALAVRVSA